MENLQALEKIITGHKVCFFFLQQIVELSATPTNIYGVTVFVFVDFN